MNRYTHTMCMAFGADGEPDRVEVDATFGYLVNASAVSDIRVLKIDGRDVAVADADLHDRIHDDLESGRFDDLLISLVTPSPQSVVVPVELAETPAIRNALGLYRSAILCGEQWSDTCRDAYLAALKELDQLAMLPAAPAPSSLAGGEAMKSLRFIASMERDTDRLGSVMVANWIIQDLAALSPEAPAREGVVQACADFQEAIDYFEADVADALAEDSERADLWDREVTVNIDALKTVMQAALTPRHEAPAEGAGEPMLRVIPDTSVEGCKRLVLDELNLGWFAGFARKHGHHTQADWLDQYRARSSAPEAREGKAVAGAALAKAMWGIDLTPAASSADKLRIAVEALEAERAWHERVADFACDAAREASEREEKAEETDAMRRMHAHNARVAIIDQALAALKAEDAA